MTNPLKVSQAAREFVNAFFRDPACPVSVKMTLGYDPTTLIEHATRFEAQIREECAGKLEARAERARTAAIGGGMDPLDASLIDYEMSNAADEIRSQTNA